MVSVWLYVFFYNIGINVCRVYQFINVFRHLQHNYKHFDKNLRIQVCLKVYNAYGSITTQVYVKHF